MSAILIGLVAVGAAGGGASRFTLAVLSERMTGAKIPGTFVANMVACLLAGIVWGLSEQNEVSQALFVAGFAGALSTWSTLAGEVISLAKNRSRWCIGYPTLTVIFGSTCALLGSSIPPFGAF